jgi:hypothetical protein
LRGDVDEGEFLQTAIFAGKTYLNIRLATTLQQKQDLAAMIHLCNAGPAKAFARGFRLIAGERCGDHDVATYLAQVNAMSGNSCTSALRHRVRAAAHHRQPTAFAPFLPARSASGSSG